MNMILDAKQTTVAYRCPHCGSGVTSIVGVFSLTADMVKLKCTCGKSEMPIVHRADGKISLTVPCMVCPKPHTFTLSPAVFFDKDLFVLSCPYTDINICFIGEANHVKAELARSELELLDLLEKCGVNSLEALHTDEEDLPDPQINEIIMYVINELDAEGKIYCKCDPASEDFANRTFDAEVLDGGIRVTCRKCGASRLIPTDSLLGAHAFLECDSLQLE